MGRSTEPGAGPGGNAVTSYPVAVKRRGKTSLRSGFWNHGTPRALGRSWASPASVTLRPRVPVLTASRRLWRAPPPPFLGFARVRTRKHGGG